MKIFEYLGEISTPTGTIYIRFREKVGEREMVNGKIRNKYYLTAFAGFANSPDELKREKALRNFTINNAEDLVHMVKTIFSDKTFISVKKIVIYDDLTNPDQGDNTPVYKRNDYLLKFFKWVEREGGDKIQIVDKVSKDGPPRLKRPKKENPNKGRQIRDIPQGETKKTVTFTVSPRFYREIQNNLPNIMKYRGPNQTFVMPNEIFMAFRKQAEEKFPFADIKVQQRVATGESTTNKGSMSHAERKGYYDGYYDALAGKYKNPYPNDTPEWEKYEQGYTDGDTDDFSHREYEDDLEENSINEEGDYGPRSRGAADGYYGRPYNPHKLIKNAQGKMETVKLTDPAEIEEYKAGYYDEDFGSKTYESITDENGPASRSLCRSKKPDSALGASQLSSCISQGLRAHKSGRADYVNGKPLKVGGKKIKGKKHGGPLPDYS